MLSPVPVSRVPYEWEAIAVALGPAVARDPKRDMDDLRYSLTNGFLSLWKADPPAEGYVALERQNRALAVVYVGGKGGGLRHMRKLVGWVEEMAARNLCREVKFEGRDWRRVCKDYQAIPGSDGRWRFRKVLT